MRNFFAARDKVSKRIVLACFDALSVCVMAFLALPVFTQPAYAYVDPSVMTYTIQALAGVAVALSAVAGVAFRRSRKAIMKLLKIDENANKDVDDRIERIQPEEGNLGLEPKYMAESAGKTQASGTNSLSWKKRFARALVVSIFCSFTLFIVAPFEIVIGATGDLNFGIGDIWWLMVAFAFAMALVGASVISCVKGKAFTVVLTIAFCFGAVCYIQALLLNGGLPQADGREVDWWGDHAASMVISGIIWLTILIVPAIVCLKNAKVAQIAALTLSVALVLVQGVGVVSLFVGNNAKGPVAITEDGLFEVSSKNNVIVFVLDMYDTKVFKQVLEQDPAMLDEMDGFTWYSDSSGEMLPTNFAVPYLLTGVAPDAQESIDNYLVRRYEDSTFLEDLKATNYSVGVYTDSFGLSYLSDEQSQKQIFDNVMNLHAQGGDVVVAKKDTIKELVKCALYRDMPWVFKPRFWFYTDEVNQRVVAQIDSATPAETAYCLDDVSLKDQLERFGLSVKDDGYEGAFRFIHMVGAHYPFNIDENGQDIGVDNSDQLRQARGSMRIVGEYLKRLKDLGLYDDATIVITSDHGDWSPSMDKPTETTEPILLFKAGSSTQVGLDESISQVSHANFHASVLDAMGADYSKYGETYAQVPEGEQRTRYFYQILHDQNAHIHGLLEYSIQGNVLDFGNWHFTGNEWSMDYNNNLH